MVFKVDSSVKSTSRSNTWLHTISKVLCWMNDGVCLYRIIPSLLDTWLG